MACAGPKSPTPAATTIKRTSFAISTSSLARLRASSSPGKFLPRRFGIAGRSLSPEADMSQTIVQPNIFPILRYRDATAAMSWLATAFGFDTIGVSSKTPPDGKNPWTTVDQGVYVSVDNPDAHHDRAKAAGATIETP